MGTDGYGQLTGVGAGIGNYSPGGNAGGGSMAGFGAGAAGLAGTYMEGLGRQMTIDAYKRMYATSEETAKMMAIETEKKTKWNITRQRLANRKLLSRARYSFGYAGVKIEGTPMDVLQELEGETSLDEEMTAREGAFEKSMYLRQAKEFSYAKRQQKKAGNLNAIGTSINAFGSILGM